MGTSRRQRSSRDLEDAPHDSTAGFRTLCPPCYLEMEDKGPPFQDEMRHCMPKSLCCPRFPVNEAAGPEGSGYRREMQARGAPSILTRRLWTKKTLAPTPRAHCVSSCPAQAPDHTVHISTATARVRQPPPHHPPTPSVSSLQAHHIDTASIHPALRSSAQPNHSVGHGGWGPWRAWRRTRKQVTLVVTTRPPLHTQRPHPPRGSTARDGADV